MNPEILEPGRQTPDLDDAARLIEGQVSADREDDAVDRSHAVARVEQIGDEWFRRQQALFAERFLTPLYRFG